MGLTGVCVCDAWCGPQDFLEALPVRAYTDPRLGHSLLNLASGLRPSDNPTDLGPKCYVAYGRVAEAQGEGDSVTKLHVDMADAVNLLLHTDPGADPHARAAAAEAAARSGAVRCGNTPANKPRWAEHQWAAKPQCAQTDGEHCWPAVLVEGQAGSDHCLSKLRTVHAY